ncbi:MAG: Flp pilus assembly complex ATPase component TadA [Chloroflexi bacterium]|nr:Flp pilus assembly complex ATPase component TadA [Chloroflexota bacterium]
MVRKNSRNQARGRDPASSARRRGLVLFVFLVSVAGVVYWQRSVIASGIGSVADAIWGLFGWGLLFVALFLAALVWLIRQQSLNSLVFRWNRWIGIIAFALAIWGILSFFGLGGSIGEAITGNPPVLNFAGILTGILRILLLAVVGFILLAPGIFYRFVVFLASQLFRRLRRIALPTANPPRVNLPSAETARPEATPAPADGLYKPERRPRGLFTFIRSSSQPSPTPAIRSPGAPPAPVQAPPRQDLKQVAQDVWKKYGESPSLVTVDGWKLPPIDILDKTQEVQFTEADNAKRAKLIEEAFASYGVDAKVVQINAGPTVTQFGVEPGWDRKYKETKEKDKDGNVKVRLEETNRTRVKVDRITSLANDLALALAAPSLRIEAPVPGKSIVGIEVPNTVSTAVSLRGVVETNSFQKVQAKSKMALALGKGAGGEATAADLAKMPHLLIAGSTGSGKTVCLNALICCLLMSNTPNDVRFVLIDPKRVELTSFNSIPHLAAPVIVDAEKALEALRWLSHEMDQRYQKMATVSARNIETYNKNRSGTEKMSYLVLVIDELADLMMQSGDEVERILCRLAQLSRAVGIHLVVATQRPSVDVVTGLIKANFPTRISFAVTSQVDSRTILDMVGAEKLLGRGDMLYMPTEADKPKRLQGCYVSDPEIERLVYFWNSQRKEEVPSLKIDDLPITQSSTRKGSAPEDPLLMEARKLAQEHAQVSASFLQRRLRIGYPRAARLMEQLDEEGVEGGEDDTPRGS